jgi:pimeloyl-ACP methyl ester carboxylesterase
MRTIVEAADGRALEVVAAGPEDGAAVVSHHGTPTSAGVYRSDLEQAAERGMRLVTYSRPGYGDSDRHEGRSVADCAADVAAIADALGIDRFHTIGASGGGPHSLACAALLPDRVISGAAIASVAPVDAEGLDWTAGMGQDNIDEFAAVKAGPEELRSFLEPQVAALAEVTGGAIADALGDLVSEVDAGVLTGDYAEFMANKVRHGVEPGIWGWFDDDQAFFSDWGFGLAALSVPVTVWHGGQDRFVPITHGEWLAAHVGGATVQLRPEHGHLSLTLASFGEILDGLRAS